LRLAESAYVSSLSHEAKLTKSLEGQTVVVRDLSAKKNELDVQEKEERNLSNMLDDARDRFRRLNISAGQVADDVEIISSAETPALPFKPNRALYVAMGVFVGLLLGGFCGVGLDVEEKRKISTVKDVSDALSASTIGFIPNIDDQATGFLETCQASAKHPHGAMAEAARKVGIRLWRRALALRDGKEKSGGVAVLVTSCTPEEGKTTILANVAVTLAQSGHKVAVIDADLRKPNVHRVFAVPIEDGLTDYLKDSRQAEALLKPTAVDDLAVLTRGGARMSSFTVDTIDRFEELLNKLKQKVDVVMIDTAPILGVSDVGLLARLADEVIFVLEAGKLRKTIAARGMSILRDMGAKVTGVVLSNVRYSKGDYFYYARYYGTHETSEKGS